MTLKSYASSLVLISYAFAGLLLPVANLAFGDASVAHTENVYCVLLAGGAVLVAIYWFLGLPPICGPQEPSSTADEAYHMDGIEGLARSGRLAIFAYVHARAARAKAFGREPCSESDEGIEEAFTLNLECAGFREFIWSHGTMEPELLARERADFADPAYGLKLSIACSAKLASTRPPVKPGDRPFWK